MSTEPAAAALARVEGLAERHRTEFDGGSMVWRTWGAGPTLLLLHGASGSWTHWIRNIEPLADRFRVVAPDMPGFGDSDALPEPHTVERLADALATGLGAVAAPAAALDVAGFSLGAIVGGVLAARLGERARSAVFLSPGGLAVSYPEPPALVRVSTAPDPRLAHGENLRRLMIGDPAKVDALAVHVHAENVRRARFRSGTIPTSSALSRALPSIRGRVASIWGERDAFVGPHLAERRRHFASERPGAEFRVIPGAGHWVTYEAAGEVTRALIDLLE